MKLKTCLFFLFVSIFSTLVCCSFFYEDYEQGSAVCFIGDSITDQWDLNRFFPEYKINKHAVSGAGLERIAEWDLSNCNGIPVVVMMGTNNLKWGMAGDSLASWFYKDFISMYLKFADTLNASKIHVISILPRKDEFWCTGVINAEIQKLNDSLKNSFEMSGINFSFIDAFKIFLGEDYHIDWQLYTDGVHLNEMGYMVLSRIVSRNL